MEYTHQIYAEAAEYVLEHAPSAPQVGIVLGSMLGAVSAYIEDPVILDYSDIPHMPSPTAPGHAGKLVLGRLGGKDVAIMSGRFHYYEGWDTQDLAWAPRLFKCLGCEAQILSNAAGGVNAEYKSGDIMIISDHIMFHSVSPLRGKNIDEFGPRFPDMTSAYSPRLIKLAKEAAADISLGLNEGIYFYMPGPQFETPAEIRAIRALGGDTVGMSTVPEAIAGAHAGLETLAFSIVSNPAAGMDSSGIDVDSINENMNLASGRFSRLLERILQKM